MKENIIEIDINKKEDYINIYNNDKLAPLLSDYILEEVKATSPKQKIKFVVTSKFTMSEQEKDKLVDMIRNKFGTDISELMTINEKQLIMNLIPFLLGVVILIVYVLAMKILVVSEIILIIGWVLIWEATYNFLFKGAETKLAIARRKQIIEGKIIFK